MGPIGAKKKAAASKSSGQAPGSRHPKRRRPPRALPPGERPARQLRPPRMPRRGQRRASAARGGRRLSGPPHSGPQRAPEAASIESPTRDRTARRVAARGAGGHARAETALPRNRRTKLGFGRMWSRGRCVSCRDASNPAAPRKIAQSELWTPASGGRDVRATFSLPSAGRSPATPGSTSRGRPTELAPRSFPRRFVKSACSSLCAFPQRPRRPRVSGLARCAQRTLRALRQWIGRVALKSRMCLHAEAARGPHELSPRGTAAHRELEYRLAGCIDRAPHRSIRGETVSSPLESSEELGDRSWTGWHGASVEGVAAISGSAWPPAPIGQ